MKGLFQVVGIKFLFDWILIGTALYVALLVADEKISDKATKVWYVVTIMWAILIAREMFLMISTRTLYFYTPGNWIQILMIITGKTKLTAHRGGGSTGAVVAFAPVNFQQRVHCTRPDEELSCKWPLWTH